MAWPSATSIASDGYQDPTWNMGQTVAFDTVRNQLWLIYNRPGPSLYYKTSTDGGETWSSSTQVCTTSYNGYLEIEVSSDGDVIIGFYGYTYIMKYGESSFTSTPIETSQEYVMLFRKPNGKIGAIYNVGTSVKYTYWTGSAWATAESCGTCGTTVGLVSGGENSNGDLWAGAGNHGAYFYIWRKPSGDSWGLNKTHSYNYYSYRLVADPTSNWAYYVYSTNIDYSYGTYSRWYWNGSSWSSTQYYTNGYYNGWAGIWVSWQSGRVITSARNGYTVSMYLFYWPRCSTSYTQVGSTSGMTCAGLGRANLNNMYTYGTNVYFQVLKFVKDAPTLSSLSQICEDKIRVNW